MLELLAAEPDKVFSLSEIAATLDLNRGTTGNILRTLLERDYVERLSGRRGYRLGPMALRLGSPSVPDREIIAAARPVLQNLTQTLNETSLIGVIRGYRRVTLDSVPCDRDLQVRSRQVRDVYETASGRLVLAYYSAEQLAAFLRHAGLPAESTWKGIADRESLQRALAKIRNNELAITRSLEHVIGLAVPVRREDRVIASASVYLPEVRFRSSQRERIIEALRQAGREISRRLTHADGKEVP